MKYKIARAASSSPGSIDLTEGEYDAVRQAKRQLIVILEIEEKFDLLLENYAEYERSLLELTLHQMLYRDFNWNLGRADLQLLNRRLANLLSAARLYLDQVAHDLGTIYGSDSGVPRAVQEERSGQYDTKLAYRVMETLRDYTQHRSLPIYGLSYPWQLEEPGDPGTKIRYRAVPSLNTTELGEEGGIKGAILDELKLRGGQVPLTPLVREYVEGLWRVHEVLRSKTSADVQSSESTLVNVEERAKSTFEGPLVALLTTV